jgi:hypothetical protein
MESATDTANTVDALDRADIVDEIVASEVDPTHIETAEESDAPTNADRWSTTSIIVAGLIVALTRFWFSADRKVFHVAPDEPSQLAIARWLAGGRKWNMFDHATWKPGLGTLLAPIYWFTDDGTTVVRWALGTNAAIAGVSAALLVVLTKRLTGLASPTSAAVAVLVGIAPASLSASSFVWAEPLVSLSFVATLLALISYYETGRFATGAVAIACAIGGFTSHSRLLPLVGTTALLVVGREVWKRRWVRSIGLGLVSGVLFAASAMWTNWILSNVWDDPSDQNTVDAVWKRLHRPAAIAESLFGQLWYQLIATLGLALIASIVILRSIVFRRRIPGSPRPVDSALIVISTVPLIFTSAVFMADRERGDQLIYGRYNDAVMWPIIVIGLAWVIGRARTGVTRGDRRIVAVTAAAMLGTGFAIDALHGDTLRESYGVRGMIAGLLPYVDGEDTLHLWHASIIATALLIGVIVVSRLIASPRLAGRVHTWIVIGALGLGAVTLGVAATRTKHVADLRLNGWLRTSAVSEVADLVPEDAVLGVKTVPTSQKPSVTWVAQRQRYQLYQLFLPERSFVRDHGLHDGVGPYVFAPLNDPELVAAGATVIWKDPGIRIGLWEEPHDG